MTHPLYRLLVELERAGIHFSLSRHRPDSILVSAAMVGERLEIDVFEDGRLEFSRFRGDESAMSDAAELFRLLAQDCDGRC